jgi:4,5-dihydroxyphthalate decarboxylase
LIDGAVTIDGVDPVYMTLVPEEIFFRAFRAAEFDICELSLSSYTIQTARFRVNRVINLLSCGVVEPG